MNKSLFKPKWASRQQVTCRCGLYTFPHRKSGRCIDFLAIQEQERKDEQEDQRLDDPRHGQAEWINRGW